MFFPWKNLVFGMCRSAKPMHLQCHSKWQVGHCSRRYLLQRWGWALKGIFLRHWLCFPLSLSASSCLKRRIHCWWYAPPSEKLSQQIYFTPAPVEQWSEMHSLDNSLSVERCFQHGNSVYHINELQGNTKLAICIFGACKWIWETKTKEDVGKDVC